MPFRCWLKNVLLALGVAVPLITFPLYANAEEECHSLDDIHELIEKTAVFRILRGDKLKRALALFESVRPGIADWTAAYLVIEVNGTVRLFAGFQDELCLGIEEGPNNKGKILRTIYGLSV